MNDRQNTDNTAGRRSRPGRILMGLAGALALAAGGMAWSAAAYSGHGGKDGKSGWSVERKVERMLDEVKASDEQRGRVQAIVKAAVADLNTDGKAKRQIWRDLAKGLAGAPSDGDVLETLRKRQMEAADGDSRRMLTALADAAEVLTPAQRAILADKLGSDKSKHGSKHKWKDRQK